MFKEMLKCLVSGYELKNRHQLWEGAYIHYNVSLQPTIWGLGVKLKGDILFTEKHHTKVFHSAGDLGEYLECSHNFHIKSWNGEPAADSYSLLQELGRLAYKQDSFDRRWDD